VGKSMTKKLLWFGIIGLVVMLSVITVACKGAEGPAGPQGAAGPPGPQGPRGVPEFALQGAANTGWVCSTCHVIIPGSTDGRYSLAWEANNAFAGHGFNATDTSITVNNCFTCHAVGTGAQAGKGNVAPISLRDIVHKVHMGSSHFQKTVGNETRPGDCYTCHVLSGPSTLSLYK